MKSGFARDIRQSDLNCPGAIVNTPTRSFHFVVRFLLTSMLFDLFYPLIFNDSSLSFLSLLVFGSFIVVGLLPLSISNLKLHIRNIFHKFFIVCRKLLWFSKFMKGHQNAMFPGNQDRMPYFLGSRSHFFFVFLCAIPQKSEFFMLGCFLPQVFFSLLVAPRPSVCASTLFPSGGKPPPSPKVSWNKVEANLNEYFWVGEEVKNGTF